MSVDDYFFIGTDFVEHKTTKWLCMVWECRPKSSINVNAKANAKEHWKSNDLRDWMSWCRYLKKNTLLQPPIIITAKIQFHFLLLLLNEWYIYILYMWGKSWRIMYDSYLCSLAFRFTSSRKSMIPVGDVWSSFCPSAISLACTTHIKLIRTKNLDLNKKMFWNE